MSSDTTDTYKRWQVWALLLTTYTDGYNYVEVWKPITLKYRDKRTADRVAQQLWLTVEVREVEENDG